MSIVVYKCDVCKREREIQRRITGLENIQKCTITQGCKGNLYQIKVYDDYIRGSLPKNVIGLRNWQQRKVLYDHIQSIEKTQWTIEHNLGTFPVISVYTEQQIEITPTSTDILDSNTVILTFDRPVSGIAQLIARSSDSDELLDNISSTEETTKSIQLTNNGELTIATLIEGVVNPVIDVVVDYDTSQNLTSTITYAADNQPSLDSPWSNVDTIIVKGKLYTVRSTNIIVPEMTTSSINNGATFKFVNVDGIDVDQLKNNQVILLLATPPYEIYDKITNQYIDIKSVSDTENQFSFYYNNGELFALLTLTQNIFPPIRST